MRRIKKRIQNRITQAFITEMENAGYTVSEAPLDDRHIILYADKKGHMRIELLFLCCAYEKPTISICGRRYIGVPKFEFYFKMKDPTEENADGRFEQMLGAARPYMDIICKEEDRRNF